MKNVAENLWIQEFHLQNLGAEQGRVVTVIRLTSGKLVIHSTAPFSADDVSGMVALGQPGWLVEAMLLHDTFAKEGQAAFPSIPYLAPEGFDDAAKVATQPLVPPPEEWSGQLEVLLIEGMPKLLEHVFFHVSSRTLIVADFVFNFDYRGNWWERFLRRYIMGLKHEPSINRVFKAFISDEAAFKQSVAKMMAWDFDRIIVGHKEIVESGGQAKVQQALRDVGMA